MGTFFVYVRLEIKRALRILPWVAAGAMALAGLLGAIALFAFQTLEGGRELNRLKVGVVLPEQDGLAKKAVSMLGSLDSVENICQFVFVEPKEGEEGAKSGEFACLMEIPEDFIGGIIDGSNRPVRILFPGPMGVEEQIFKELADAGARTLSSAQAGIYAANHMNGLYGVPASIKEAEQYLNAKYLSYSMDRESYYRKRQVSSVEDVAAPYHYAAAAAVFLLLLSGIPAAGYFSGDNPAKKEKLKLLGIGMGKQTVAMAAGMAVLLLMSLMFLAVVLFVLLWIFRDSSVGGQISSFLTLLREKSQGALLFKTTLMAALLFTAASLIVLFYSLTGTELGGMMALFLGTCGMMVFSGGFLPQVFLPESFQKIGVFLPTTVLLDGVKRFFIREPYWPLVFILIGISMASLAIAAIRKGGRA